MKITERFKKRYSDYVKSYLPQEVVQNPDFEKSVFVYFDELAGLASPEVCNLRKKGLSLNCDSSALAERTLMLASGEDFIAGPRFKNLDINFPFVEINLGMEMSSELLSEVCGVVQSEFKEIRPKGLKFKDQPAAHSNLDKWSHTVFGKIEKQEILKVPSGLTLSFTQNLEWHQQYVSEYRQRLSENEELKGFVRIGQLDEFEESANASALLVLKDAHGLSGVIAGIDSPLYGLPAIYMIESYLSQRWVGKKIASSAHGFFLNEMSSRYKYVWGTIYDKNLSSLNTALRIGRRVVETEYFVPFSRLIY